MKLLLLVVLLSGCAGPAIFDNPNVIAAMKSAKDAAAICAQTPEKRAELNYLFDHWYRKYSMRWPGVVCEGEPRLHLYEAATETPDAR
jgi:hypothetical protein